MQCLLASEVPHPFDFLTAAVIGVPSLFWGTRLTFSGFYERQHAIENGQKAPSAKLATGTVLMILGIALLGVVTTAIVCGA
jgi:uncharacterized membrane protein SpoIIM required for sporulation